MKWQIICIMTCLMASGFMKKGPVSGENRQRLMAGKNLIPCTGSGLRTRYVLDKTEPWTEKQLMAPAELAGLINDPKAKKPIIICVGPGAMIKGSIDTGPAKEKENLEKLKAQLSHLPSDSEIVIYCGCCPFDHCPNIRPAFSLLNEMKFTHAHLLNLEHNLKTDWISKGYPQ